MPFSRRQKMDKVVILVAVLAMLALQGEARKMSRCQLVRELRKYRFPENKLRDWVCLVEHESGGDKRVIGKPNSDGSRDHGLFQINDRYWCSASKQPGNGCHVTCAELRSRNLRKAVTCVRKIFKVHGFLGWNAWRDHCQAPGSLPDISKCRH